VLGAVAQLERALIAERTKAGLSAARNRGRVGGNPGLRAGDPEAIRKVQVSRDAAHLEGVLLHLDAWLPTVRRMRPRQPWGEVVRVLNHGQTAHRTVERLRRTVRRLAAEGIVEAALLERARPQLGDDRLTRLVAGTRAAAPDRTLQQIAAQLEAMRERRPRGGTRWHLHRSSAALPTEDFLRLPSVTVRQATTNLARGHTVVAARLVLSALAPQSAMDAVAAAEIASTTGIPAVSTHQKSASDMTLPSWLQSLIAAFKVYFLPLRPAQQEEGEIKQENPGLRANFAAQRIYRAQVSAATTDAFRLLRQWAPCPHHVRASRSAYPSP
jgi:hypothetical protein